MSEENKKLFEQTRLKLISGELSPREGARRLFSYGYSLDEAGNEKDAQTIYRQTVDALERACLKIGSYDSEKQLAECASYHGQKLLDLGRTKESLAALKEAEEHMINLIPNGVSSELIKEIVRTWKNLVAVNRRVGDLNSAAAYQEKIAKAEKTLRYFS